jgi:hypothetical protein
LKIRTAKLLFVIIAAALIALNFLTLLYAIPLTTGSQVYCDSHVGCINVSRDFSAYYEGGYRFIHNPSFVYQEGNLSGDYAIAPNPQQYRYSPFFLLLFIVPLVLLFDYHSALFAFDIAQFLLLPIVAYLLFQIMKLLLNKNGRGNIGNSAFALFSFTLWFALLQPFTPSVSNLTFWSWSYFRLWLEGEARVLQTLLLVLTFYLILRNSKFSGVSFVLSSFDPRMSVLCLPLILFLCLKQRNLRMFSSSAFISFLAIYLPTLSYANLGSQFFATIFIKDFSMYSYELIPLLTVVSLTGSMFYLHLDGWFRVHGLGRRLPSFLSPLVYPRSPSYGRFVFADTRTHYMPRCPSSVCR